MALMNSRKISKALHNTSKRYNGMLAIMLDREMVDLPLITLQNCKEILFFHIHIRAFLFLL